MRFFAKSFLLLGCLRMASAQFAPNNLAELKTAVNLCIEESGDGLCPILANTTIGTGTYGAIGSWDVSKVTSFAELLYFKSYFNQPIGDWNTSSVTTLYRTFYFAWDFNQPIGNWDVSKVTSFEETFRSAYEFNQPIGNWDVSKVTSLYKTFSYAYDFNQPIGNWDVGKVTSLKQTFDAASDFNQPIGNWDVSKVTSFEETFYDARKFNQNLSSWVTTVSFTNAFVNSAVCTNVANGKCDCDGSVRDVCGVCRGTGIPEGTCDCAGNYIDVCGVCGGTGFPEGACDCAGNGFPEGTCDCAGTGICVVTTIKAIDSYGDGWNGYEFSAHDSDGNSFPIALDNGKLQAYDITNLEYVKLKNVGKYITEISIDIGGYILTSEYLKGVAINVGDVVWFATNCSDTYVINIIDMSKRLYECVCPTNGKLVGDVCVCPTKATRVDNECVCPIAFPYSDNDACISPEQFICGEEVVINCDGVCGGSVCANVLSNQVNIIDATNLNGPYSVTVSPDGKNVYAVASLGDSIVHWDRNSTTGALSNQVNKIDATNLNGARSVTVSPDGKNVYAVAGSSDSIVHWDRDSTTGALSNQVNLTDATNLNGAFSVTVSPDGKNVYAVAFLSHSIVHWDRDSATGALFNQRNVQQCVNLNGANSVTVSPDGKNVYAVAFDFDSIVHWDRSTDIPDVCGVPAGNSLCLDKNGGTLISKNDCDNGVTVPTPSPEKPDPEVPTPSPETPDPETSIPVWLIVGLVLSLVLNVVVSVLYAVMICNKKAMGDSSTPRALYTKLNLYTNEIKF